MTYAELGISALLLVVVLGEAVRATASRLRRIRRARVSDRRPVQKNHGTHSAPRDYRTDAPANSKGLRLAMERSHAKREQRRREKREFQAWLEITSEPLW
ncbi:hypothetical protein [Mycolicibacterium sp. CBMA 226]|uniref:hypothetical protein n=1 Tax=Mycolicibacterium sp. CBMA 226 TaxID=2606611 RepID=UPI0012DD93FD|nr:hypothetical protein [Mycolicibacterium sp. CBMA 226]MUL77960.1 hypothetical protein [Mycolicibacterium sp. CBMA 226]